MPLARSFRLCTAVHDSVTIVVRSLQDFKAPVVVWDATSHSQLYQLLGMKQAVTALSFSPDDRFLAGASADKMLFLWDMEVCVCVCVCIYVCVCVCVCVYIYIYMCACVRLVATLVC